MQNVTDSLSYNFVKCSVDAADFFDLGVSLTLRSGPGYPLYPDGHRDVRSYPSLIFFR